MGDLLRIWKSSDLVFVGFKMGPNPDYIGLTCFTSQREIIATPL